MTDIPRTGFLRVRQIVGDPLADPPIPALVPIGRSTWLEGVRTGKFPKPVKLSPRIAVWRCEDIRALIEKAGV